MRVNESALAQKTVDAFERPFMPITSLRDFCQLPRIQTCWPIAGLLSTGLTLLTGDPRSGKTMLAMQLMLDVVTGTSALNAPGRFPVSQGSVLYLALDCSTARLQELFTSSFVSHSNQPVPENLYITNTWERFTPEEGLLALEAWLEEHRGDARLIVLDNLVALRRLFKGSDCELLALLRRLAERQNVSILLLHTSKAASPLVAYVDNHLHLKRLKASNYYQLDTLGVSLLEDSHLLYNPAGTIQFQLAPPEDTAALTMLSGHKALTAKRLSILSLLHERGEALSPAEVASTLNLPSINVRQALHMMASARLLAVPSYGKYAIHRDIQHVVPNLLASFSPSEEAQAIDESNNAPATRARSGEAESQERAGLVATIHHTSAKETVVPVANNPDRRPSRTVSKLARKLQSKKKR